MRNLAVIFAMFFSITLLTTSPAHTGEMPRFKTKAPFLQTEKDLTAAIRKNKMGLVSKASATHGAAAIGVKIKGNRVFGVYHPRFAVRMLQASIPAGIEAPIRIYLYENTDGTATITYKKPSDVFRPYGSADLDKMAAELDVIFAKIVQDAR
ncbi:MAG: DUF302 domain-containing protein [Nitrospinaceae bacterium]|jgi:uncharacterized protein (DUF302 family)|nr:DUF302 domain-containing protein [Nitrospinaceae bacterium]MBT3434273.1 DUF302 domain-containing protein [Nitrospinaceae bacterium]MBT3819933.1 DUF302 domain-containing protein [Nitrospinaceae bacterium]MBT4093732.1 DUF302 domain-containing protein [Nitrospinaceae bacterium]MBT4430496.1 DUF302 domain-containing protein [Nitrospinaceae bacterium]